VERSENLSERLHAEPLRRLALTLILRDTWFEKNNLQEDGRLIEELLVLNQPLNALTPAILRPLARPLEMSLNPEAEENLLRLARVLDLPESAQARLLEALQRGIAHQVLNAKRHAEESQIIAGAGAFGAVTIATNMAGRGVDIKLGGELAEEVLAGVNRILRRNGVEDPYDLTNEQRRQSLQGLSPDQYGIYAGEVEYFLKHMREEGRVRELGGLHILGSERHEARRIDNQLRGRSARQGDPGSSRFYLSLEDDLMRRFGGSQVSDLMQRLKIDDAVPLASGLVSRLIEQAQTRVEGANFDVRKHLLEYDDVLNAQRNRIYAQRDRIFEKEDLSEDIRSMLENEVGARVQDALHDAEGPWRLLAWLDETQPPLLLNDGRIFPSYSLKLIQGALSQPGSQSFSLGMEEFAGRAMQLEGEHLLRAFEEQAEQVGQHAEEQVRERRQAAETALEGVGIARSRLRRWPTR
jgi:preprotein translocase subunit SecA